MRCRVADWRKTVMLEVRLLTSEICANPGNRKLFQRRVSSMGPASGAGGVGDLPLIDARSSYWLPPAGSDNPRVRTSFAETDPHPSGGSRRGRPAVDERSSDHLRSAMFGRRHLCGGRSEVLPDIAGRDGKFEFARQYSRRALRLAHLQIHLSGCQWRHGGGDAGGDEGRRLRDHPGRQGTRHDRRHRRRHLLRAADGEAADNRHGEQTRFFTRRRSATGRR